MLRIAAVASLASFALGAEAQNPKPAEVWFSAGHIELTVSGAAGGLAADVRARIGRWWDADVKAPKRAESR